MRPIRGFVSLRALAVSLAAALAACAEPGISAPGGSAPLGVSVARVKNGPTLLACPGLNTEQASAMIGAAGGTLAVGGQLLAVPAGAVPTPTLFTMSVPPGPYLEIDVRAAGAVHYEFARPVSITIDYSRCRGQEVPLAIDAWYIDASTKEPLADMNGVDDRSHRRLTFVTDHLSGYALAW